MIKYCFYLLMRNKSTTTIHLQHIYIVHCVWNDVVRYCSPMNTIDERDRDRERARRAENEYKQRHYSKRYGDGQNVKRPRC